MNRQGLATDEQWEEDPTYWIQLRMDVVKREAERQATAEVSQVVYSGDSQITNVCGCTEALKLRAGYAVYAWGVWWPNTVSTSTVIPKFQEDYSAIIFNDVQNDHVKPYQYTQSLKAIRDIQYQWAYLAEDAGHDEIASDSDSEDHYYAFTFSTYEETMDELIDVENGSEFRFDVEVTDISIPS